MVSPYEELRLKVLRSRIFKLADPNSGPYCLLQKFEAGSLVPLSAEDKAACKETSREATGGEPFIIGLKKLTGLDAKLRQTPRFLSSCYPCNDGLVFHWKLLNGFVHVLPEFSRDPAALFENLNALNERRLARDVSQALVPIAERYLWTPTDKQLAAQLDSPLGFSNKLGARAAARVNKVISQTTESLTSLYRKYAMVKPGKPRRSHPLDPRVRTDLIWSFSLICQAHCPDVPPTNLLHYMAFLLEDVGLERGEHWRVYDKLRMAEKHRIKFEHVDPGNPFLA